MTWTPAFNTIKTRAVADNLLAFIAANQADAILWATSGSALKPIKQFSNSVMSRTVPVFPSIAFASDQDAQDYTEDVIESAYSVVFEIVIENANPDTAVTQARSYAAAIVSMIRNCPPATLAENTGAVVNAAHIQTVEVQFDEIKTNDTQTDFFQTFQIRAVCSLIASNNA